MPKPFARLARVQGARVQGATVQVARAGVVLVLAAMVALGPAGSAMADADGADPDQIACEPDVHRLCEDVYPDVEQVASCLVSKRQQLSTPCATALAHPPAEATETK